MVNSPHPVKLCNEVKHSQNLRIQVLSLKWHALLHISNTTSNRGTKLQLLPQYYNTVYFLMLRFPLAVNNDKLH